MKSLSTIQPYTKLQLAEILYRPLMTGSEYSQSLVEKTIQRFSEINDSRFRIEFIKSSGLMIKKFAPGMFYFDYN